MFMFLADFNAFNNRKNKRNERIKQVSGIAGAGLVAGSGVGLAHLANKSFNTAIGKVKDTMSKTDPNYAKNVKDYLGVDSNVKIDQKQARKIYRNRSKVYHPDTGGSDEAFKKFKETYDKFTGATPRTKTQKYNDRTGKKIVKSLKNQRNLLVGGGLLMAAPSALYLGNKLKNKIAKKKKDSANFSMKLTLLGEEKRKETRRNAAKLAMGTGLTMGGLGLANLAIDNNKILAAKLKRKADKKAGGFLQSFTDSMHKSNIQGLKTNRKVSAINNSANALALTALGGYAYLKNRKTKQTKKR